MPKAAFKKYFFTTAIGTALVISGGVFAQAETRLIMNPMDANIGANRAFTAAALQNGGAEVKVSFVERGILPGSRILLSGVSAFTADNGAMLDASTTLTMTDAGKTFLPAPIEFFSGMRNVFSDPADGVTTSKDGSLTSKNKAGGVTSLDALIPEPAMLILFGLGLAALGVSGRCRPH